MQLSSSLKHSGVKGKKKLHIILIVTSDVLFSSHVGKYPMLIALFKNNFFKKSKEITYYSNKGCSSGNNRNEDKATTIVNSVSQQRAEMNACSPAPQSPDQAGWRLYCTSIANNE